MKNEYARRALEWTGDTLLRQMGLLRVFRSVDTREAQVIRILAYHRVHDCRQDRTEANPDIMIDPGLFAEQIKLLARHYDPVGVDDLRASLDGTKPLPRRAVLVTVDDGYRDFLTQAWPVLKRYSVPVVLFVPSGYPDRPRPFVWDELWWMAVRSMLPSVSIPWIGTLDLRTPRAREAAARRLRRVILPLHPSLGAERMAELRDIFRVSPRSTSLVLGWHDLRTLANEGVAIAPHTRSHASMPSLTDDELEDEIMGSVRDLERELPRISRIFAFPYGHVDMRGTEILSEHGFVAGFSASPGRNTLPPADRYRMFRQCVGPGHSVSRMQLGLSGFYPFGLARARAMAWLPWR